MPAIDVTTIVVTRVGFVISAHDENGSVVKESYLRGPVRCEVTRGNFEDEPVFGDNDRLVSALCSLVDPVSELCEQLRKQ